MSTLLFRNELFAGQKTSELNLLEAVDSSVIEIKTYNAGWVNLYRAIIGKKEEQYYFFLEKISSDAKSRLSIVHIKSLRGAGAIKYNDRWVLGELETVRNGFKFTNRRAEGSLITIKNCRLELGSKEAPYVSCI